MKRVFVTGASGFIGRHVVRRLIEEGFAPTALLLPAEPDDACPGAAIVRGDLAGIAPLSGLLDGCNAVVHVAGAVGAQSWELCRAVNVEGTRRVLEASLQAGVRRFVHMSSVSVYGRVPGVPITEESPLRRIGDPYGDTKIAAEELLREAERAGKIDLTVLRPTAVCGPGDQKFLPTLTAGLRRGDFRIIGDGTQPVDLIRVEDVAAATVLALKKPESIGKTYNLARRGNPSWNEFVAALARELGIGNPVKHVPYQAAYAAAWLMEQAAKLTGKPPRLTRYAVRLIGRRYDYRTGPLEEQLGFRPERSVLPGAP